jgi:hypothetical protein
MMKTYYYSKNTQSFYVSDINDDIPGDAIEITEEQYHQLLTALNDNCIIFDNLTVSEPRPSQFHLWKNGAWIENVEEKNKYIASENIKKKSNLLAEADKKIAILQDIIDLDMQESNEIEQLKNWKKYRILLTRVDTNNTQIKWPEDPAN